MLPFLSTLLSTRCPQATPHIPISTDPHVLQTRHTSLWSYCFQPSLWGVSAPPIQHVLPCLSFPGMLKPGVQELPPGPIYPHLPSYLLISQRSTIPREAEPSASQFCCPHQAHHFQWCLIPAFKAEEVTVPPLLWPCCGSRLPTPLLSRPHILVLPLLCSVPLAQRCLSGAGQPCHYPGPCLPPALINFH